MLTERQQQIIETAVRLVAVKGIQNFTIKNLSTEIGISEPAIYRHFVNKLDVLKNILIYLKVKMKPAIDELKKEDNSVDCIINFINTQFKIFGENHNLAKVIFAEANFQNVEELKNSIFIIMNSTQKLLNDKISAAQQKGQINNQISAINLTRFIIGSMRFLVTQWNMSDAMFDIENEGKLLCADLRKIMEMR
jgi:TetR/AcrR family transcriptional regulator, fatty acid metabolism regulator protein